MEYIDENKSDFNDDLKAICLKIVENVAKSYEGIVQEEKELLKALKTKLNSF